MKEQSLPIVPWIGGKRRLAKHILPLFPAHTCYVEPFSGAAALYFLKTPSKTEVINDIKGKMIISVNDIPEMRQAFDGLNIQTVDISYNLKVTGKASRRKELVICNF